LSDAIYLILAEKGNAEAQWQFGMTMLDKDNKDNPTNKTALGWIEKSAAQGHPAALNDLGGMYFNAWGIRRDYRKAMECFRQSARKGFNKAFYNVGLMYDEARGVKKDIDEAVRWYWLGVRRNNVASMCALADIYTYGPRKYRNKARAVRLMLRAARTGDAHSQYHLALYIERGIGCNKDHKKAMAWLRKSADKGFEEARGALHWMWTRGEAGPGDEQYAKAGAE